MFLKIIKIKVTTITRSGSKPEPRREFVSDKLIDCTTAERSDGVDPDKKKFTLFTVDENLPTEKKIRLDHLEKEIGFEYDAYYLNKEGKTIQKPL